MPRSVPRYEYVDDSMMRSNVSDVVMRRLGVEIISGKYQPGEDMRLEAQRRVNRHVPFKALYRP